MAALRVDYHPEAATEFDEAVAWYHANSQRAAEDFYARVRAAEDRLGVHPGEGRPYLYGTRRVLLRRYPYLVVFRAIHDSIQIVAVAHGKRRPGYWKHRLTIE